MPRDKSLSHEKIIRAAIDEFNEHGYEKASMRSIGEKCGLTAAALYRHFDNKAALFRSLVEPALKDLNDWMDRHAVRTEEEISKALDEYEGDHCSQLWDKVEIKMMEELIYPRMEEYSMLVNKSSGSEYGNFMNDLVSAHQERMMPYFTTLKERGYKVKDITPEELHILLMAYCKALFEPVAQGYTLERALKYLKTVDEFFSPGWRELMGY